MFEEDYEKIIKVLINNPPGLSIADLMIEIDASWKNTKKALIKLKESGKVKSVKHHGHQQDKWVAVK